MITGSSISDSCAGTNFEVINIEVLWVAFHFVSFCLNFNLVILDDFLTQVQHHGYSYIDFHDGQTNLCEVTQNRLVSVAMSTSTKQGFYVDIEEINGERCVL